MDSLRFSIIGNTNTFNLRIKVETGSGLLLWTGGDEMSPASDFLLLGKPHLIWITLIQLILYGLDLGIDNGYLHFRFNLGNGEGGVVYNHTRIDDGRWHRIRATRYACNLLENGQKFPRTASLFQ